MTFALRKLNSNPFSRMSAVRSVDGRIISDQVGVRERRPPAVSLDALDVAIPVLDPPISEDPPTLTEVREKISKLKGGKAAGICDIPAELLKAGSEPMAQGLRAVLAAIRQSGSIHPDLIPDNVFTHILLKRIRNHLLRHRRPEQSGIIPGKSTIDHILVLRIICGGGLSIFFPVNLGVWQGCVLAPTLFNTCMDWIIGKASIQSQCEATLGNIKVTDLDFAVDVTILFEFLGSLIAALDAFSNEVKPLDLQISWTKTKIQDFGGLLGEPVQLIRA
ncbi:uncharacterized protein [Penaeus vannamei]|uniref:uncharacterized protein n=1 Tax=Penaeus vannamei TaxID=6689 RepID=UPI00387F80A4